MTIWLDEDALWQRMPLALLTGFLGSGKTTLLNRLVAHPSLADTAIAINEFGDVALDQAFVDHGEDGVVAMANGCLCCAVRGDFEDAMLRLFTRRADGDQPRFKRLIVEASGLAEPGPILEAVLSNPLLSRVFRLDRVIATVDAVFGVRQLDQNPEAVAQAAIADRLVVTKSDIADPGDLAALQERLRTLNPSAPQIVAVDGAADPADLFSPGFFDPDIAVDDDAPLAVAAAPSHHHGAGPEGVTTIVLETGRALDWRGFERWLRTVRIGHSDELLRLKGIVAVEGEDRPVAIHGVHHVLHPPVRLSRWPNGQRRTQIVLITRGDAAEAIRQSWEEALKALV